MTNNDIFSGKSTISFYPIDSADSELERIICDSLDIIEAENIDWTSEEPDYNFNPIANGRFEFSFEVDKESIDKDMLNLMLGNEPPVHTATIILQPVDNKSYILKPHNLKHPQRKRAKRIMRKWCNRFGWHCGEEIVIPKATIIADPFGDTHITAQESTPPKNYRKLLFGF